MNEYYGAPNDFRNYVSHAMDKRNSKGYKGAGYGIRRNQKEQTAEAITNDRAAVQSFKDAEKIYLQYRGLLHSARIFRTCDSFYDTAKEHVNDAIGSNRALTDSEKTTIRQFVDKVEAAKEQLARLNGTSNHVSGGSRY